jgi:hypothetical protein
VPGSFHIALGSSIAWYLGIQLVSQSKHTTLST